MSDDTKKPEIVEKLNDKIMTFNFFRDLNTAPGVHAGLNPVYLGIRQSLHHLHRMHLEARRQKMRELLIQDFLRESKELEEVQFGFINTQP